MRSLSFGVHLVCFLLPVSLFKLLQRPKRFMCVWAFGRIIIH